MALLDPTGQGYDPEIATFEAYMHGYQVVLNICKTISQLCGSTELTRS